MNDHKTAKQLHNIARCSDQALDRAIGAVLELAEAAAREGLFEKLIPAKVYAPAEEEVLCGRLRGLGYESSEWSQMEPDGSNVYGILVYWGRA